MEILPQFKLISFQVSFLSRVKMNSINWSAPNIWVFIAQLVERCSANAEAIGLNPIEALSCFFFSGRNLQLLRPHLNFICILAVQINFISRRNIINTKHKLKVVLFFFFFCGERG